MPVGLKKDIAALAPVAGVRLAAGSAGIRAHGGDDLMLMELCEGARTAAVFTRNAFCAAPVVVAREHLAGAMPRLLLVNAGNANAGTGRVGLQDARRCCTAAARATGCRATQVLPFSTGVIGERLPAERIETALPALVEGWREDAWAAAARAIMTTDTVAKGTSRRVQVGGQTVTVTGIAKGAGMICPDMATMLAFVATDAAVARQLLAECLGAAVEESFNRITVDGDTSTNDACVLVATGRSGAAIEDRGEAFQALGRAVTDVCTTLAQSIVRDGEGATRFVPVEVCGGRTRGECLKVAYAIAHSPLVKTALFAGDPNWGRILAAMGRSGVPELDIERVVIHLGGVCIVRGGGRAPEYTEQAGQAVMGRDEIPIRVDLGLGGERAQVWTTDLSYEYVKINAEYRS
ncbi:MAG: bifunctional glutamate N-acetyltransferase/amino-acid acetyltransferase ArgJ [Gammaproteobacteria bacterium]|nr:bifunctional glutamate N-acetyltransferase/amino-acid acetyltransferase ArgJ [Gammaproteobacteria bacterium]NIR98330.1 bifunctional glutamate N-acetyltransferase/amino-acid acetyltransferase ArgJ [Gammaproteobacteria bacterium]NIT64077.1 bifunctional glutamate N-acetyltransferase/amino-acid acetyltransferase ArgJ [Gammaproteobacteria bacterium]NIV21008.1 bifunctional glutamate N-acetyltransferase/amino-acid acetyltransferase ArgJ [Gammaproteobacteria bacterium]NIX10405.1 bifunctional glutama